MTKVMFISHLKDRNGKLNSTDIMTQNILCGLSQNNIELYLLALYDSEDEIKKIEEQYRPSCSGIFFVRRLFHEGQTVFKSVFGSFVVQSFYGHYKKEMRNVSLPQDIDIIISNKITIDEIIFGKVAKTFFKGAVLYEYWSDPMALLGINYSLFKRMPRKWIFKIIEKKALKGCDRIIYGTKTLLMTQSILFKEFKTKMFYVDICYSEANESQNKVAMNNKMIYAGNYYNTIRNILELARATSLQNKFSLDIYGSGNVELSNYNNVHVHGNVAKKDLDLVKSNYSLEVCVLNKFSTQIPGKIFYNMNSDGDILVLADGPMQEPIIDYLKKYRRFQIVKNDYNDILLFLNNIESKRVNIDLGYITRNFSPKIIARTIIEGGMHLDDTSVEQE